LCTAVAVTANSGLPRQASSESRISSRCSFVLNEFRSLPYGVLHSRPDIVSHAVKRPNFRIAGRSLPEFPAGITSCLVTAGYLPVPQTSSPGMGARETPSPCGIAANSCALGSNQLAFAAGQQKCAFRAEVTKISAEKGHRGLASSRRLPPRRWSGSAGYPWGRLRRSFERSHTLESHRRPSARPSARAAAPCPWDGY
jgi:hypothetical protein